MRCGRETRHSTATRSLSNGDQVRREEARNNFQIKGRRYIFLKNVDRLTQEEKEALSRLEAQNLDTIQAMQIRMNLQQLFTMSVKSARRFLDRWNAWVQVCDLAPMKKLAKTITAKSHTGDFHTACLLERFERATSSEPPNCLQRPRSRPKARTPRPTARPKQLRLRADARVAAAG